MYQARLQGVQDQNRKVICVLNNTNGQSEMEIKDPSNYWPKQDTYVFHCLQLRKKIPYAEKYQTQEKIKKTKN